MPVTAAAGWELTATPTTIGGGQAATVALRLTDTDGSGDIACARVIIGPEFEVLGAEVLGTSAPSAWAAEMAGTAPTVVSVRNPDGNGKLKAGDWVDFSVTVGSSTPGTHSWTANALQNNDCTGDPFLEPITAVFSVESETPTPAGAEPIAPPAAALPAAPVAEPSLAPVLPFTSVARRPDAGEASPTPLASSRALSDLPDLVVEPVGVGGGIDDARAREASRDDVGAGPGTGALVAVLAILGAVGIYWALVSRRARGRQQP
jgi:hypothetical protein